MKKIFLCLGISTVSLVSISQPYVSLELGNRIGINVGYIAKNKLEIKTGALVPYTRSTVTSNITYAEAGYKIGNKFNVTPMVGISRYHNTVCGVKDISYTNCILSLETGIDFETVRNNFGNYYIYCSRSKYFFCGAGLKIFIK